MRFKQNNFLFLRFLLCFCVLVFVCFRYQELKAEEKSKVTQKKVLSNVVASEVHESVPCEEHPDEHGHEHSRLNSDSPHQHNHHHHHVCSVCGHDHDESEHELERELTKYETLAGKFALLKIRAMTMVFLAIAMSILIFIEKIRQNKRKKSNDQNPEN
ncbi:MAG: hypothetical protein Kow0029_18810 [Candidatus Rifleibacteriota bacterium]